MKWRRKVVRVTGIFLLLLTFGMLAAGNCNVQAAQASGGRMVVQLKDLGTPMSGVGFSAYEVGFLNSQGTWELVETLNGKGVELDGLEYASQWDAAASRLAYLAGQNQMQGTSGMTDSNGQMVLEGLSEGMYLVVQKGGKDYGEISPFLTAIPYEEDGVWKNEVTVHPKASFTPEDEKARITVTKRAGYLDPELMEVVDLIPVDATYYVGIFLDDQGKVPYGADYIRAIHMEGISTGKASFEDLPKKVYYIFETDENGNAIPVDEEQEDNGITWVCQLEDHSSQEINLDVNQDSPDGSVGFYNMYYDLPDGFLYKGNLDITKEVLRGDKTVTVDDVFYAGVFFDKEATDLVTVEELEQNGTIRIEVPLGGEHGDEPITYYVYETDEDGIPVSEESFEYLVSGEDKAELRKGSLEESVTITNTEKVVTPTPTPTETITPTPGSSVTGTPIPGGGSYSSPGGKSPKTGDDTPIGMFLALIVAAAAGGGYIIYLKRRKKV